MSTAKSPLTTFADNQSGKPPLDRISYAPFVRDFKHAAMLTAIEGGSAIDFFMTDAEWLLDPRSINAAGNAVPKPGFRPPQGPPLPIIQQGMTAGQLTLAYSENTALRAAYVYEEAAKLHMNEVYVQLKTIICDASVVGESIARVAQNGFGSVTDSFLTIFMRVGDEIGIIDEATEVHLKSFYRGPAGVSVPVYISDEGTLHETLATQGMEFTTQQRYQLMRTQFETTISGAAAIRDFDTAHPRPADKTLANFHAWMRTQSANILAGSVRQQIYPGLAQAAAATPAPIQIPSSVIIGSPMYAAWENIIALTNGMAISTPDGNLPAEQAFAATGPSRQRRQQQPNARDRTSHNQPHGQRYCWKHGFGLHTGIRCVGLAEGETERWTRFDTRSGPVFDGSRTVGHRNCRHTPPCISEEMARAATGPRTHPTMPGNESIYSP